MSALGIGVTVDLHIVGRIEKCRVDRNAVTDHSPKELRITAIATTDAVLAQNPDVAKHRFGLERHRRNDFFVGIVGCLEYDVDLAACKAGERQVEIDIERADLLQLKPKN